MAGGAHLYRDCILLLTLMHKASMARGPTGPAFRIRNFSAAGNGPKQEGREPARSGASLGLDPKITSAGAAISTVYCMTGAAIAIVDLARQP